MRTPPRRDRRLLAVVIGTCAGLLAVLALALPAAAAGGDAGAASTWRSAFERRVSGDTGQRMIVVLSGPSLAEEVARTGSLPGPKAQRKLARAAIEVQRQLVRSLAKRGIELVPEQSFSLTLNGFSAVLDGRAVAALEDAPAVVGIYPVRTVYPASLSEEAVQEATAKGLGGRHGVSLDGFDGDGVTIALLDTGVDWTHRSLRGSVLAGIDLVEGDENAAPGERPGPSGELEAHGTRMAGILVGQGAGAPAGVAPGATVLPIRILGWQRTGPGEHHVLGTTDLLLAGLERAVDPDGDGSVEDAARIALVPVVEPYAAFVDSPEARAVAGAVTLGTLVVAAAGNDGPAGAGFGTIGAPGAAPAALTVGAADLRAAVPQARVEIEIAGEPLFAGDVRLLGGAGSDVTLAMDALPLAEMDGQDLSGIAVVVAADGTPLRPRIREAARSGAGAVLVYGSALPAGALALDEDSAIPVVAIPARVGRSMLAALDAGRAVSAVVGPGQGAANLAGGRVAAFSSQGPAFDGRPKPDVIAAGVGVSTADAGRASDGSPRYATVTGSSAAAAVVAGAAALLAQARPELDAVTLRAVLVGSARPVAGPLDDDVPAEGAGLVDVGAALGADLAVTPPTLALGRAEGDGWHTSDRIRVRNLGDRPLRVHFELVAQDLGKGGMLSFGATPSRLELGPGEASDVRIDVEALQSTQAPQTLSGVLQATAEGAAPARIPWLVTFASGSPVLIDDVVLDRQNFRPSTKRPAVLSFRAGWTQEGSAGAAIEPVSVLDVELLTADGKSLGTLLRLRNVLPGRYAIGLTGRGSDGVVLPPGDYQVRLRALPVDLAEGERGRASVVSVDFTVRKPKR